jgi:hypothetical protein
MFYLRSLRSAFLRWVNLVGGPFGGFTENLNNVYFTIMTQILLWALAFPDCFGGAA